MCWRGAGGLAWMHGMLMRELMGGAVLWFVLSAGVAAGQGEARVVEGDWWVAPPSDAAVRELVDAEGVVYFMGRDAEYGEELWRSDGTVKGTRLVVDAVPGPEGSAPEQLVAAGGKVFYVATDAEHGWQLWCSDGTAEGTGRVTDFAKSSADHRPSGLMAYDGEVWFQAPEEEAQEQQTFWRSDGTAAGTREVVVPAEAYASEGYWGQDWGVRMGDHFVSFRYLEEMWSYDPGSGTWEEIVLPAAFAGWRPDEVMSFGGRGFFSVWSPTGVYGLLECDGTSAGTRVPAWWDGRFAEAEWARLTGSGEDLLITIFEAEDRVRHFISGGDAGGMEELEGIAEVWAAPYGGVPARCEGGFVIKGYSARHGIEPWFSDGTATGSRMIRDLRRGEYDSMNGEMVSAGKVVYFTASSREGDTELWQTNGKRRRTFRVKDVRRGKMGSYPQELTASGGEAYWTADDGRTGRQLWTTAGRGRGARRLTNLPAYRELDRGHPAPEGKLGRDGLYYFMAPQAENWSGLWATDGSKAGTRQLTGRRGSFEGAPLGFSFNGEEAFFDGETRMYFRGWTGDTNFMPWMTDGSPKGTKPVFDVEKEGDYLMYSSKRLGELGGHVIYHSEIGQEELILWRHDGGAGEGSRVMPGDARPGGEGEELLYFTRTTYAGTKPWVTDGTLEGTRPLKTLQPVSPYDDGNGMGSNPGWLGEAGGKMFFSATTFFNGRELWVTDGTDAGTGMVKDLEVGKPGSDFQTAREWGGELYFIRRGDSEGNQLWRTDGTSEGTVLLTGFGQFRSNRSSQEWAVMSVGGQERLFFTMESVDDGPELWVTDGTSQGTRQLVDISPGQRGSHPQGLTVAGGRLYFSADDGVRGSELWVSDGTWEGTALVEDRATGKRGSNPRGLAFTGGRLFYTAWTPEGGRQLHVRDEP